ncbi:MAG: GntR family transcriptional regulator, partial [Treponema sp.]|nr:GntR family transcriptional regulator [Treponema sp.]
MAPQKIPGYRGRLRSLRSKKSPDRRFGGVLHTERDKLLPEQAISFSLDAANGVPIYRQIIQQIEYAVLSERMRPGDKLPTIRSLAVALKINPNTIAKAYGELEIRGVLATQVG